MSRPVIPVQVIEPPPTVRQLELTDYYNKISPQQFLNPQKNPPPPKRKVNEYFTTKVNAPSKRKSLRSEWEEEKASDLLAYLDNLLSKSGRRFFDTLRSDEIQKIEGFGCHIVAPKDIHEAVELEKKVRKWLDMKGGGKATLQDFVVQESGKSLSAPQLQLSPSPPPLKKKKEFTFKMKDISTTATQGEEVKVK